MWTFHLIQVLSWARIAFIVWRQLHLGAHAEVGVLPAVRRCENVIELLPEDVIGYCA